MVRFRAGAGALTSQKGNHWYSQLLGSDLHRAEFLHVLGPPLFISSGCFKRAVTSQSIRTSQGNRPFQFFQYLSEQSHGVPSVHHHTQLDWLPWPFEIVPFLLSSIICHFPWCTPCSHHTESIRPWAEPALSQWYCFSNKTGPLVSLHPCSLAQAPEAALLLYPFSTKNSTGLSMYLKFFLPG